MVIYLPEVLRLHGMYLRCESGGVLADLRGADLRGASLSEADLRGADLRGASLSEANLRWANLRGANLRWANLRGANLCWANLRGANLCGTDLSGADLRWTDLRGANLRWANLRGANLCGTDLSGADLRWTDLRGADLRGAIDGSIARLDFGGWSICVRSSVTSIGCQMHANESWLAWLPESPEIVAMHREAPEWWRVHGEAVKAVIRCVTTKAVCEKVSVKS